MNELESLIRSYVKLGKRSPKGFEACRCAICHDYKERGGFNFTTGVSYNCFNCSATFGIKHGRCSKAALETLAAFGVPESEVRLLLAKERLQLEGTSQPGGLVSATPTPQQRTAPLPAGSTRVTADSSGWGEVAREYLSSRGLSPDDVEAYVSTDHKYEGRIILPVRDVSQAEIVYWQARSLDESIEPRFKNPTAGKERALFNQHLLYSSKIIYVTEGIFDAVSCKTAVALLGGTLSDYARQQLRAAARRGIKVVGVIDKNEKGYKLGLDFLAEGWSIVVMPDNITDANDCLVKLGKLFLLSWLATSVESDLKAAVTLRMKCNV